MNQRKTSRESCLGLCNENRRLKLLVDRQIKSICCSRESQHKKIRKANTTKHALRTYTWGLYIQPPPRRPICKSQHIDFLPISLKDCLPIWKLNKILVPARSFSSRWMMQGAALRGRGFALHRRLIILSVQG